MRKNCSKALEFYTPLLEDGGAVIYSFKKIQVALNTIVKKEKTAEAIRFKKEETKYIKAQEKVEKQQVVQNWKRNKAVKKKGKAAVNTEQFKGDTDFKGASFPL